MSMGWQEVKKQKDSSIGQELERETRKGWGRMERGGQEDRAQAVETAQGLTETELFTLQAVSTTGLSILSLQAFKNSWGGNHGQSESTSGLIDPNREMVSRK